MYFESICGGPDKFILSVKFSFSIREKKSVLYNFCLSGSCCVLFLIHDEYGIGLNVISLLHGEYFGNLDITKSVVNYLFVNDQRQLLLHICILIVVMFRHSQENLIFWGISTVVFLVKSSGGVFRLSVSGNANFFLQSKLGLEISLELIEIDKLYGFNLIFV